MTRCALLLLSCLLTLGGCAAPSASEGAKAGSGYTTGKADGAFEIYEVGPLALGETIRASTEHGVQAFRIESYGDMTLSIDLRGIDGSDPLVVVEGPLADHGDSVAPGAGAIVGQDDDGGQGLDSRLEVTLAEPGVYRVLAGTYESLGRGQAPYGGAVALDAVCTAACTRPAIPAKTFLQGLKASGQLDALLAQADGQLAALVPDDALRTALTAQLRAMADADFEGIERFPIIPLRQIGTSRAALGLLPDAEPQADAVVDGELRALLGACQADRSPPSPLSASLPGVGYGHFPSMGLTACQNAHSRSLAQILTSLAADNGSVVRYDGRDIRSAEALVDALVDTGHVIEVRNERTYANFISLTHGDTDIVWPVWLDTGVTLADGNPLLVPMGHSHHAFRVSGPDVDARVMFYLGISGAAFFAQVTDRPAWTGEIVTDASFSSDEAGRAHVRDAMAAAGQYLRRIRVERETVAAGLPADGYGFLGVCNDSNAVLEHLTRGTITAFPLMRAAELDGSEIGDGLDDVLRALPKDGDIAPDRADALRRVLLMTPHALDSDLLDPMLRAQLQAAQAELLGG